MLKRRQILAAGLSGLALPLATPMLSRAADGDAGSNADQAPDPRIAGLLDQLDAAGKRLTQMHSLQVMRGPDILYAKTFRGPGLDTATNIKSVSKTLVTLLLGCAVQRKEIADAGSPLSLVAPDLIPEEADPAVSTITLGDLASLRAGLQSTSGPNYGAWVNSPDWVKYALTRPMVADPGGKMIYSTGSTHVLGAALSVATGQTLLAQMRDRLGKPLGITIPAWTRDPQGYYLGGNEMSLTPRAMLKIAQMVRDAGRFGGTQVIPQEWIRDSLTPRGRSPFSGLQYGYGWFLTPTGFALGRGYGGQILAVHPDDELAVVITSDPTRPAPSQGYFGDLLDLLNGPVMALA